MCFHQRVVSHGFKPLVVWNRCSRMQQDAAGCSRMQQDAAKSPRGDSRLYLTGFVLSPRTNLSPLAWRQQHWEAATLQAFPGCCWWRGSAVQRPPSKNTDSQIDWIAPVDSSAENCTMCTCWSGCGFSADLKKTALPREHLPPWRGPALAFLSIRSSRSSRSRSKYV